MQKPTDATHMDLDGVMYKQSFNKTDSGKLKEWWYVWHHGEWITLSGGPSVYVTPLKSKTNE